MRALRLPGRTNRPGSWPGRRLRAVAAIFVSMALVAGATYALRPPAAGADIAHSLAGSWGFALDVDAWGVPDQNIGTFSLRLDGACEIRIRASFGGFTQDQRSTTCTWAVGGRPGVDGAITATGITPTALVLSFVAASGNSRLLLLLDETPPGAVGTGEAFRR